MYLGQNIKTNEIVAVKLLRDDVDQEQAYYANQKEVETMKKLWDGVTEKDFPGSKYVTRQLDYGLDSCTNSRGEKRKVFYIVLEYAAGGELFDFLANTGRLDENWCRYYFKQLMEGLDFIHKRGFVHRDLKPENLMLDSEGNLKIADFGFSAPVEGKGN